MKIDLSKIFCEISSGLAALGITALALHLWSPTFLDRLTTWSISHFDFPLVVAVFGFAYVVGLVIDSMGFAFDDIACEHTYWLKTILDLDCNPTPPEFYAKVSEHTMAFWKEHLAYYSCYRNLFLLTIPAMILGVLIAKKNSNCVAAVLILIGGVAFEFLLIVSIRSLQRIVKKIGNDGFEPT